MRPPPAAQSDGPTPQRTRNFDYHLSDEKRRIRIAVYFADELGAPVKDDLDGVDGTIPAILRGLDFPAGSRGLITPPEVASTGPGF